ncbi:D-amino-acid oxidase [Phanerochaete sordida]|uniref:D-amino-acid oxidase n=1 Tax=Phanerochaete sordida TaxID=48140 RepID=A0A9P3L8U5_9APHY|nr:D-amino-acid oxidase [Phanerochaete sordida]
MSTNNVKNVVVVGAGVVGLTTALKVLEKGGFNVTIVAETFPSDPKTIRYTSLWAGAHHVSHAEGDLKQQKIDEETFKVMWEMSAPGGEAEGCFLRLQQTDYFYDGRNPHLEWMPDYAELSPDSFIPDAKFGIKFTTLTIDTPAYCNYLLARFLARGGTVVRGAVQHLQQVAEGGPHAFTPGRTGTQRVDAIIACPGLGARTLGGVEDKDVFPVRGQVVLVRAPWIKFGRTASHLQDGRWTYVIPRRSGDVILGGTKVDNDWCPVARPETTTDILERCLALCPELVPPEVRAERTPTIDDLRPLIVEEGCGFRPARKGGVRIDVEWIKAGEKEIPVVMNYGHGGGGYQSSWGTAAIALELLEESLSKDTA